MTWLACGLLAGLPAYGATWLLTTLEHLRSQSKIPGMT